jgi:hypothetical protein
MAEKGWLARRRQAEEKQHAGERTVAGHIGGKRGKKD